MRGDLVTFHLRSHKHVINYFSMYMATMLDVL